MNEKQLRELVAEEIQRVLDEERQIDSHPKFRRLVEARLGTKFETSDEHWTTTYNAWSSLLQECGAVDTIDRDSLEYYVEDAAKTIADS
jgi:hypothetical protein